MLYRSIRLALATAVALALPAVHAQAPAAQLGAKSFTIVAPFPPGGPVDILARMLATGLGEQYKQAAVVDNRPGGNGNIGIDLVKRAAADGHTLLVVPAGNLTINPTLMPNLGYVVDKDFAPVSMMARTSNVIAVNPSVPAKTIGELVALSKAKPNTISYASPGVGSGLHLAGELLKDQTGADFLHIAYKGSGPGLNDTLGGTVPMIIGNLPTLLPHLQSGRLRALAVTDAQRDPAIPNVPTLAEAGVKGVAVSSWYGVLAPKGTPPAVVDQLARDVARIMAQPANQQQLQRLGMRSWIVPTAQFGDLIRKEAATWAPVIRSHHIEAQ
jgi:tripartite-type tricarboxylate transporter receptor subunit TctC